MRRTSIKPKRLYELAREYLATQPHPPPNPKGGRPRTYDDALILTIASIQNLNQYSFREALEYCEDHFPELPALSTYHDRLEHFTPDIAQGFIRHIGTKIVAATKTKAPPKGRLFVMDGTGFSYHDSYPMKFFRGMEIRKIRTHVKIGALMGRSGKRRFVVSARAGPAYTSDVRLIQPLLEELPNGRGYVLGDKGFDSHRIMTTITAKGYRPAVAVKQNRCRIPIKDPLRIRSKKYADTPRIYDQRTLVEGLFGNVKQKLSSHVRIFKLKIAQVFALLRFALLNVSVLVAIEGETLAWLWFPNSARCRTVRTRGACGDVKCNRTLRYEFRHGSASAPEHAGRRVPSLLLFDLASPPRILF